jgi:hypothetical protein
MKKLLSLLVLTLVLLNQSFGQVYSNKVVGEKNASLADSLKVSTYPYLLPIWGEKVTQMGFDLPYSAGLGINYIYTESDIIIEDLMVGFNNGPMYDLDEIVRFKESTSIASGFNLRGDIWVFPFLNVYGMVSKANTSTSINAGVWLPDTSNVWQEIAAFSTTADFKATGLGFGMTPTVGLAGGFLALDMNVTWQDISALDKPVFTFVFGPRFGKSFKFKNHPQSNIALWVGGFRLHIKSETSGSLALSELFPTDELQVKVDEGLANVESGYEAVEEWYSGLSEQEQQNPINQAKYETANRTLDAAGNILNTVDGALNDDESATVQYSLTKKPKDMWNFVVGTQYQINKHFMFRLEAGFLGSREQIITGLQYRFGL